MAITLDQLLAAIAGQESGGLKDPYSVVNAYGAVGKYQVLKGNVPEWSRAALGYSITWQQFRNSPSLQEKIVRHRMSGYFDKYGARGAASAWYSGDPKLDQSVKPQKGGPSIKSYVDSVIKRAGNMPSGGSSSSGESSSGGGSVVPLTRGESAEQYGYVERMLDAIPEMKVLFDKAVKGGWTPSKFQAEARNTNWFKTHSESERQFLVKQYGDPAQAGQMWNTNQIKIQSIAGQLGATLDWNTINTMAYGVMALGWSEEKLRRELAMHIKIGERRGGQAGEIMQQLEEYGYQMGFNPTTEDLQWAAREIIAGNRTIEDSKNDWRTIAKGVYSNWAEQIDGGQTVMQLASPYFQAMSTILELPPGSLTLDDPTIKKTLQSKDPQTGANRVKQLWEFENDLRNDDRWKKTQNAQNSTMQVAHQVLADFGFAY